MLRQRYGAAAAAVLLGLFLSTAASAQPKTDIIVLANGDHITGEVKRLERGRLEVATDDIGTLQIEWDNVARVEAGRTFEVVTEDGRRVVGQLAPSTAVRVLSIVGTEGTVAMPMGDVAQIVTIGTGFWQRVDGSLDVGFNYAKSSGVGQFNVTSTTTYRRPAFESRLRLALAATRTEDGDKDDRGSLEAQHIRYNWPRWYVAGGVRLERNESLGLRLRSQLAGTAGPRFVNTTRTKLAVAGGLAANNEQNLVGDPRRSLEAMAAFYGSYFTYDKPTTDIEISVAYFRSLTEQGRRRLQFDARAEREVYKDLFVALSGYDSYDSRPPSFLFYDSNDFGVTFSIGWKY